MEWITQSDQTRISVPCRGWPEVHTRQMCAYISTWRYLLAALLQLQGKHQKPLCRFSPGVTLQGVLGQPCPVQRELQLPTKKEQTVSTHGQEQGCRQIFSSAPSSWHTQPWGAHTQGCHRSGSAQLGTTLHRMETRWQRSSWASITTWVSRSPLPSSVSPRIHLLSTRF